jgi:hypothetical protein
MTIQNIKYGKFSFKKTKVFITPEAKDLICKLLKVSTLYAFINLMYSLTCTVCLFN